MTPIAAMVEKMMADGVPAAVIVLAVQTAELVASPPTSADSPLERRRAYDRERMRKKRESRPTSADSPPTSDSALTLKKDKIKKVSIRHRLSADWKPTEKHFAFAAERGIPTTAVESKAEDMRIWAASSGELKADWDATFMGFLRRDAPKLAVQPLKLVEKPKNYVRFDDPEMQFWEAWERKNPSKRYPRDKHGGWEFPSRLPPEQLGAL